MAQWSKWLGHSPGLQEVQVQALSNPPFFIVVSKKYLLFIFSILFRGFGIAWSQLFTIVFCE